MKRDGLGLPGGESEAWNLECTLNRFDRRLTIRVRDVDWHRPDLLPGCLLGGQNGDEILIADCRPEDFVGGRRVDILGTTRLKHSEQFARIEVGDGDGVEFTVAIPVKDSGVDSIVSMDRFRGSGADKKAGCVERSRAIIFKSDRE